MIAKIIRSQVLISLASVTFYWSGFILLGVDKSAVPVRFTAFILFATFLAYNLPVITKYVKYPEKHKIFIGFYTLIIILVLYISLGFGMVKFIYLIHLGIISFAYNYPFKSKNRGFLPARSIPFLKILLVAYVWASIGTILPALNYYNQPAFQHVLVIFVIQFLFIVVITLPFDIRDYLLDKHNHIKTIPGFFGIRSTRIAGILLSVLYMLISILTLHSAIPFIIIGLVMIILIFHSNLGKKEFYYTGVIDGFIIIYWLILFISSQLGMI